jgi:hypothetical protein
MTWAQGKELNITRAAGKVGIIQGLSYLVLLVVSQLTSIQISSNATCSVEELALPGQLKAHSCEPFSDLLQLYVNTGREE